MGDWGEEREGKMGVERDEASQITDSQGARRRKKKRRLWRSKKEEDKDESVLRRVITSELR